MKIKLLDLEFSTDYFYIKSESIVEKITFNNRTFYSKFEKNKLPISDILLQKHQDNKISLALPLVENNLVNYLVLEYQEEDWKLFYSLLQYLLKSLNIINFQAYRDSKRELFQLFIPKEKLSLELAYQEVEEIKNFLNLKFQKSYKIYPNQNLPKNLNIITLPSQKV